MRSKHSKIKTTNKNIGKLNMINIIFKIIAFAFAIITIIFYTSILKLDLLPNNYIIVFTIAEIIFSLLMIIGLAKKHKTYKLNI